jgi:SAM-dependent methyltransferase
MKSLPVLDVVCPACEHRGMSVFFENLNAPVFCNVLWEDRQAALDSPRAPIRLGVCRHCGLIYNIDFNPCFLKYSQRYENSLHYSSRFQQYAEDLACRLVKRHRLYHKNVIEIGCGQGDFLNLLASAGDNRAVGFDPSFDPARASSSTQRLVKILPESYSSSHAEYPADMICCRQVLEHIARPLDFLKKIRNVIGDRTQTIVFFEVPNALYTLRDRGIWDIIYEHCSYFTADSITALFRHAGFEPISVGEQYGGQFITIEARIAASEADNSSGKNRLPDETEKLIPIFHIMYQSKTDSWARTLADLRANGRRTVIWGAGSKGITFLNTLNVSRDTVEYVVDVNPHKQSRFLTGTGQEIVPPRFLKQYAPHNVVLMNSIYQDEIRRTMRKMNLKTDMLLA